MYFIIINTQKRGWGLERPKGEHGIRTTIKTPTISEGSSYFILLGSALKYSGSDW